MFNQITIPHLRASATQIIFVCYITTMSLPRRSKRLKLSLTASGTTNEEPQQMLNGCNPMSACDVNHPINTSCSVKGEEVFLHHGYPHNSPGRLFLTFEEAWRGMDGIEVSEGRCLALFKNISVETLQVPASAIRKTSHRNLVNLKEVFLSNTAITLVYDRPSESLRSLRERNLKLGIVEVATICKEVYTPCLFLTILNLTNYLII
jgi:hypothetical protein